VNEFSIYGPALEARISKYTDVLVIEDLNDDILGNDRRIQEFKAAFENLSLHIVSRKPINFHGAPSCIDLFCTNVRECVGMFSQNDVLGISTTHDLIYGSYMVDRCLVFFRDFKHIDMVALLIDVRGLDWSDVNISLIFFYFNAF
jgi:hypothetical protein